MSHLQVICICSLALLVLPGVAFSLEPRLETTPKCLPRPPALLDLTHLGRAQSWSGLHKFPGDFNVQPGLTLTELDVA